MRPAAMWVGVVVLVGLVGLVAGSVRADGVTDTELSAEAANAYLEGALAKPGSLDDADYRELARVDDDASGVQAIALERRRDHAVVVAYAGTNVAEPADVLADLGLAAAEIHYLMTDAAFGDGDVAGQKRWHRRARSRPEAARLRAAGAGVTRSLEAQLAVSRRFLEQVLAMQDLDGQPIVVAAVVVTGHSLGGFIAQIIAAERGARAVTFNGPGAQHYAPALHSAIIRNLVRRHDPVGNFGEHIGTTELWPDVPRKAKKGESKSYLARNHSIAAFHASLEQSGT